jgi:hypothetical protein
MTVTQSLPWYQASQQTSGFSCDYCQSAACHEPWCITQNLEVLKAWQAVLDPSKLSLHDELVLHALGVMWVDQSPLPHA